MRTPISLSAARKRAIPERAAAASALEVTRPGAAEAIPTADEVDAQLHKMMETIHRMSAEAAEEYGLGYDLVAGANIAGFKKVAEAMMEQGCF